MLPSWSPKQSSNNSDRGFNPGRFCLGNWMRLLTLNPWIDKIHRIRGNQFEDCPGEQHKVASSTTGLRPISKTGEFSDDT